MLYDVIATLLRPAAWWGRMRVQGRELVPAEGPVLVVPNHDSQWDPVMVGLALKPRRRLRFLARASLWRIPGLAPILHGLHQIPVRRGAGDAQALERAVGALRSGEAVCVFCEGGLSWGERVRAHSGVARLAQACPGATIVLCAVEGTTEFVRFPRRPRVRVSFFSSQNGDARPDGTPAEVATRLLDEIRARVPPAPAGRHARVGGPARVRKRRITPRASRS
jgi:1-acyl-sn-glycerol-3-phosphate acyltransferase